MKFEAGKSYRLIDPEGFKNESPMNETYWNIRSELKSQEVVKCLQVAAGAVFDNHLFIYNRERKYFEEIG